MAFGNENALGNLMFQGGLAHGGMTPASQLGGLAIAQSPVAPAPAQSPEEQISRAGGWQGFLEKLSEPGMQSALLSLGTQLLQPVQPGQSTGGHLGAALQNTMLSQQAMTARRAKQKQEQEKLALEGRKVSATEKGVALTERQVDEAERRAGVQESQTDRELRIKEEDAPVERKYKQALTDYAQARAESEKKGTTTSQGATIALVNSLADSFMAENPEKYPNRDAAFIAAYDRVRMAQGKSKEQYLMEIASEAASVNMWDVSKPEHNEKLQAHVQRFDALWDSINGIPAAAAPPPATAPTTTPETPPSTAPNTGTFQRTPTPEITQAFQAAAAKAGMEGVTLGPYSPQGQGWMVLEPNGQPKLNANGQVVIYAGPR